MKTICIMLVIIAHTLIRSYGVPSVECIRFCCLCFTMPMFFFMSGILSSIKPFGQTLKKSTKHLLIPCIFFSIAYNILQYFINPAFQIRYDIPGFAMWYLWVLFIYRLSLPLLIHIPYITLFSFLFALLVPLIPWIGDRFALSRIVCFLPYFLLGYSFKKTKWPELSIPQIIMGVGALLLVFSFWILIINLYPGHTYRTAFNSAYTGNCLLNILLQAALIGTICITGTLAWLLIPEKLLMISKYGNRIMTVYLLHGFIVLPTAYCLFRPFAEVTLFEKCAMIIMPTSMCLFLFNDKLHKITSKLF